MKLFSLHILVIPNLVFALTDAITLKASRLLDDRGGVMKGKNIIIQNGKIIEIGTRTTETVYDLYLKII